MARPEGQVRIAYGAVRNTNNFRGGFCPVYWNNGRQHGNTFCRGFDRDEACQRARADAREEVGRYAGDWDIRFTDSCASGNKKAQRAVFKGSVRKPTIYEALRRKIGREPTNPELKAEVKRIIGEAYVATASRGKLPHQRKRR